MGVIYTSVPIDKEVKEYLDELEIEYSKEKVPSKNPSPNEILSVLGKFQNLNVESGFIRGAWQAQIENKVDDGWTTIHIMECNELACEGSLSFEKGEPKLIIQILKALSNTVGIMVLTPDTGEEPLVIDSDLDVDAALSSWEHTAYLDEDDDW